MDWGQVHKQVKQKRQQTGKTKLIITLEVLNEVKTEFPKTKEFIEERLEQKCLKENISVEEVIYIFTSLGAKR